MVRNAQKLIILKDVFKKHFSKDKGIGHLKSTQNK